MCTGGSAFARTGPGNERQSVGTGCATPKGTGPCKAKLARQPGLLVKGGMQQPPRLSPRQRQVLELRDAGRTIKEIATTLQLSPHTARHILEGAIRRLKCHGTLEALAKLRPPECRSCPYAKRRREELAGAVK